MEDTLPLGNINNLLEFEEFLFIRMKWEFNLVTATISARQGGRWRWLQQQRRRRLYGTMRNWANWISTIILLEDPSLLDISKTDPRINSVNRLPVLSRQFVWIANRIPRSGMPLAIRTMWHTTNATRGMSIHVFFFHLLWYLAIKTGVCTKKATRVADGFNMIQPWFTWFNHVHVSFGRGHRPF